MESVHYMNVWAFHSSNYVTGLTAILHYEVDSNATVRALKNSPFLQLLLFHSL